MSVALPARPTRRAATIGAALVLGALLVLSGCQATPVPFDPKARPIVFPVDGKVRFSDTWGAPRSGGRVHMGQDLMGGKLTRLVAVADGTVTWLKHTSAGNAGNYLVITDADGWQYSYMHINNDMPGTDDGANRYDYAFAFGIRQGQKVKAGEFIGYMGDSGNAEGTSPHLHFEMKTPTGVTINPYTALVQAKRYVRTDADTAADRPQGSLESVKWSGSEVTVKGWGLDAKSNDPIQVSVLVNGNPLATVPAKDPRPDLLTARPGRGDKHGFTTKVTAQPGAKVCVVLHSKAGGANTQIGCK